MLFLGSFFHQIVGAKVVLWFRGPHVCWSANGLVRAVHRHIMGNPFKPYPAPLSWPTTVVQLADALYNGHDCRLPKPSAMPAARLRAKAAGSLTMAETTAWEQGAPSLYRAVLGSGG
jgi:hypothetical protein